MNLEPPGSPPADGAIGYIHADRSSAAAWAFVFLASQAGWKVDRPRDNGFGFYNVTVWDDTPGPARTPPRLYEPVELVPEDDPGDPDIRW